MRLSLFCFSFLDEFNRGYCSVIVQVFDEDGGTVSVAEDVEVFFPVGVAVAGVVGANGFAFEGVAGGLVDYAPPASGNAVNLRKFNVNICACR